MWKAITQTLVGGGQSRRARTYGRNARQGAKEGPASAQFARDRKKYSLSHGNNEYIARARKTLEVSCLRLVDHYHYVCVSFLSLLSYFCLYQSYR